MPCRDEGWPRESERAQKRLDEATRAACEAITALKQTGLGWASGLSNETLGWWTEHEAADTRRRSEAYLEQLQADLKLMEAHDCHNGCYRLQNKPIGFVVSPTCEYHMGMVAKSSEYHRLKNLNE